MSGLKDHVYIFVGGQHYSGAAVVDRILSSQYFSSGFRPEFTIASSTGGCQKPLDEFGKCHAPNNEGVFLTKTFSNFYLKNKNEPCITHSASLWGLCAQHKHLIAADVKRAGGHNFKNKLLEDWNIWWNTSKPYLIESDVSNMVKSLFLQELFGKEETAFIFVLRVSIKYIHFFI